jgi:molybdate transport system substrate-binding protein
MIATKTQEAHCRGIIIICCAILAILGFQPAKAVAGDEITVAVAANFYRPMQEISAVFELRSGNKLRLVNGSTGKLYAQIIEGAPFDIFFAADRKIPVKLERKNLILPGSRFTYATGKLLVYTARKDIDFAEHRLSSILLDPDVKHIAIADPVTAPYGRAAMQALKSSGIYRQIKSKLVYGENIGQTFLFVHSGNADIGLIAASSAYHAGGTAVPVSSAYDPIVQQAVLLRRAKPAAHVFVAFLATPQARAIIRKYGFGLPQ